ncbi:class I SAM-dependent methyltransferase [Candidatus Nitrosocosmicus franklandus]|uniref:tRNA (Guanine-N(7)-)-methyltransferase n=1 Tax=Candidatus Nitrosocosmicus franklandianus TaxID=1798806 RepID=A0A484I4Z7_9ARCH|nr:class I SAM-dependent methyltransferase [Candidatus Nitrosocosmicus franklandus]VFJ12818.1 tRNA (Guanine-N(7)-)-methyltransferase [Candidatus Nitrosocosmicus franklandus]
MLEKAQFDNAKAEAFSGKLLEIINGGCLSLLISVGHKTGLFDVMSGLQKPATSEEIAKEANLCERYVREWLGGMVVGGIVEYYPDGKRYLLPPEHSAFTTRAAGINNLALFSQYVSLMGLVEDKIVECFRNGGGVPYSDYPGFQALQAEETSRVFDSRLINDIVPLTGQEMISKLQSGASVLEVGCGRGHALNLMAKAFPNSKFFGFDFSEEGIEAGIKESQEMNLTNVIFEVKDVNTISETNEYDLVMAFDTIHDQAHPTTVLSKIRDALKFDGVFLMQDIAASSNVEENIQNPLAPSLYTFSTMHCMTVSLAQNGEGLGTVWGRQMAEQKLKDAGFSGPIDVKQIGGDVLNYYYVVKKTQ